MKGFMAGISVLLGVLLALYPLTIVDGGAYLLVPGVVAALLLMAAATTGIWGAAVAAGLLLIGEYALALLIQDGGIDALSAPMAAALLLELELIDLTRLLGRDSKIDRSVLINRIRFVTAISFAGLLAAGAALIAGAALVSSHPLILFIGAAAALATMWVAATLTRALVIGRPGA
jgi:hypothetical protein